jgi:hypothetical protein
VRVIQFPPNHPVRINHHIVPWPFCPGLATALAFRFSGFSFFAVIPEQESIVNQLTNYEIDKAFVTAYQQSLLNQTRAPWSAFDANPGIVRRLLGATLIRLGEQVRGRHQQCLAERQREISLKLAS